MKLANVRAEIDRIDSRIAALLADRAALAADIQRRQWVDTGHVGDPERDLAVEARLVKLVLVHNPWVYEAAVRDFARAMLVACRDRVVAETHEAQDHRAGFSTGKGGDDGERNETDHRAALEADAGAASCTGQAAPGRQLHRSLV
jgi:chorismate mutase